MSIVQYSKMVTIRFNIKAKRFQVVETGKFIKEATVLELLDNYRTQKSIEVNRHIEALYNSAKQSDDYTNFLDITANELKNLHFVNYVVGRGGVKALTNQDIDIMNKQLKKELTVSFDPITGQAFGLQEVTALLENGEISQAQFSARISTYVRGTRKSYWQGVNSRQDLDYVKRNLNGDNHCQECISYAAMGVVRRELMPLPGEACSCRSNCNCTLSYLTENQYKKYLASLLGKATLEETLDSSSQ